MQEELNQFEKKNKVLKLVLIGRKRDVQNVYAYVLKYTRRIK